MNCKVQRKHCRDQAKARQRKTVDITKVDKPHDADEIEKVDTPKKFGDLITSDPNVTINEAQPARPVTATLLPS